MMVCGISFAQLALAFNLCITIPIIHVLLVSVCRQVRTRLAGENMAKIHIKLDMMANEMGANGTVEQL